MYLITSQENFPLAEKLARNSGLILTKPRCNLFSSGEIIFSFDEDLANQTIHYIFHLPSNIGEELFKILLVIDSLKRNYVKKINLIISYLPYLRQNHLENSNDSYGCKLVCEMLEKSGVDKIFIIQPHFPQINGFFKIHIQQIILNDFFEKIIKSRILDNNSLIISTDLGAYKNCKIIADHLKINSVLAEKTRNNQKNLLEFKLDYNLEGKNCIIIDDMIDTGQTLFKLAQLLKNNGANRINAYICHLLFAEKILGQLEESPLEKLHISNTIPHNISHPKLEFLDISGVISNYVKKT